LDNYEQVFKIPVSDVADLALLEANLTKEFWSSCLQRFFSMREDDAKFLH